MPGYADVEDPGALLAQDPGLEGGASIEEAISDAGFQVQAVNWVWEKVVGEDLVSSIITPITGDFEQIARGAAQWNNVRDALQAVRNNLNGGLEELRPSWSGDAADTFYDLIGTTWTLGIEADAQAAKLIGIALSKVADGSKRACDQILDLIEKLVNKLIEAAAMLPIPVVGWGRAVKLVYDGIQIYNAIMSLIDGIQQIIEGAQQVIQGIIGVGTALSKLGSANSVNDLLNVANEAGQGIADVREGATSVREGATQASSAASNAATSASSAADNARGLADERSSARTDNTSNSSTSDGGTAGNTAGDNGRGNPANPDGQSTARPDDPDSTRTPEQNRVCENDPVDVASGEVVLGQTDVELPGVLPLVLKRTHISSYRAGRFFGRNWASTLDQRLEIDKDGVVFVGDDGVILVYPEPTANQPVLPVTGPRWELARSETEWTLTQRETGRILRFAAGPHTVRPLTAISDRNGNRIDIDRDPTGVPTAVRHHGGYHVDVDTDRGVIRGLRLRNQSGPAITLVRYGYHNESGLLAEVLNSSNRALRFEYDTDGRLTQWTDRNDQWYRYFYDGDGRCIANQGSGGFLNGTFTYQTEPRTTRFTDALGNTTTYQLDARGNVTADTDPLGNTTTSEWDTGNRLVSRTDPLGRTTAYTYDADGNITTITRADGRQAVAEYNEMGQPVEVTDPDGAVWSQEFDERGNRTSMTNPAGASSRYSHDDRGNVISVTNELGAVTRITVDSAGLPVTITDASGAARRLQRDQFGRIATVTDAVGAVTRFGWTITGQRSWRTLPDGATERWAYDGEGNQVLHVDPSGRTSRMSYTQFDLPASQTHPDGSTLSYAYDPQLRLISVTNSRGQTWRYERDAAGNVVGEVDFDGREIRYSYDAAGQLIGRSNGAGEVTEFRRDQLGHVVERRSGDQAATFEFDPMGRMLLAVNSDARVTYERDVLGRVTAETVNGRTVSSEYDLLGRRVSRRTPTGTESLWAYDGRNRPRQLRTAGRTLTFGFDPTGKEIEHSLDNGTTIALERDRNGRISGQTVSVSSFGGVPGNGRQRQVIQHRRYRYRTDGSIGEVDDQLAGKLQFDLDHAGRVTRLNGPSWTENYAYDEAGNISAGSWPEQDRETQGPREYEGSRLVGAGAVRYYFDAQGRMIRMVRKRLSAKPESWRYAWNADDRLTEVTTPDGSRWRYRYDALGRRIAKEHVVPDGTVVLERTDFTWDGLKLAEEVRNDNTATTWNWHPRSFRPLTQSHKLVADQDWFDKEFYSIVTDAVGTPTELVDDSGSIAWRNRSTLWGRSVLDRSGGAHTPWRFPGQYHDAETGLNYNYFRYYDPENGRYVTADPLGLAPSSNHYTYVPNPLRWLDPLGLMSCEDGDETTLYRNVDGREFDSIAETGEFSSGGGSSEGKWFALNGEHADRWGSVLNGGDGVTMETNIPNSLADQLHHHPGGNLDGIGPAVYADADQVEEINRQGDGVRIWEGNQDRR
ncbi:DUF6531 domain-containing protein [Prauserella cavernicola]|uniref:RHS domain-containing protein n=1 Tax=Prauserella cavernicola TaxID=2800127 RepID=A0A934V5V0_9PSEU|nr:DUF6531 domain-containing protein [Prauserella cavernicola]MBK1786882.1 RHS domain-containing protein [Prauserella cavernicola]